jgi:beta-glucanase (GH16 family)
MFAGQMNCLPYLLVAWLTAVAPLRAQTRWTLAWSDEFDGPANSAPDQSKWTYDLGAGGGGNHELEVYTDLRENSFLDGKGNLVIRAQRSTSGGYTSARLKTQGKFSTAYGKIEARIKLPYGQGVWPAFWMLGSDIDSIGWPACGEIDVMENIGREP